ncbi:MAG TPA: succinate dehydrogenase [Terriglobia bacterium]|nr:succinate dehydrogenase [Terriglobia bacterium]
MPAGSTTGGRQHFGGTMRRDVWWLESVPVIALLAAFAIYATLRAFEGTHYTWGPYLSPFYSPLIDPHHHWWPLSPALLILIWPLGFRVTCYYYRKAYYRAFFFDPPACAVGESGKHRYRGETAFPFVLQNLHRYFLYVGFIFLAFLWRDAFRAFFFDGRIGVGVGTLVLLFNVILLTTYALSCHSLRHLAGGKLDCFSCTASARSRHTAWRWLSILNERHMLYAWISLITVGLTDFYVRLVAIGTITDLRLL